MDNLTEACSLGESCLSSRRGGDSLRHKPEDRAKAGGNGGGPADRSASHDSLWKEGGVIQWACARVFPGLDSGRGGSSPSPGLAVYTRRSFPRWEPRTQLPELGEQGAGDTLWGPRATGPHKSLSVNVRFW